MKFFNVILVLAAIVMTWLSKANTEDKIFLTIFFSIAIGFWLVAMHDDRKRVA
jgi:Na+/H+-dicarboxylate symporter